MSGQEDKDLYRSCSHTTGEAHHQSNLKLNSTHGNDHKCVLRPNLKEQKAAYKLSDAAVPACQLYSKGALPCPSVKPRKGMLFLKFIILE